MVTFGWFMVRNNSIGEQNKEAENGGNRAMEQEQKREEIKNVLYRPPSSGHLIVVSRTNTTSSISLRRPSPNVAPCFRAMSSSLASMRRFLVAVSSFELGRS
jgi:hypothetical protein